jgi:hypothetical protein
MADIEQLKRALVNADRAGDEKSARNIAAELKKQQTLQRIASQPEYNPTDDMSTTQRVLAGIGMGMTDGVKGLGQLLGMVDQQEIDEDKKRNADLMNTGAGTVGNVLGNVAMLAPTALIPGANTVRGAALINSLAGAAMTPGDAGTRGQAALYGGAGGAAGVAIPKAIGQAGKVAQAAAAPFSEKGRNKIIGEVMRRAAGENADDIIARLKNAAELVPGSKPTAADVAESGGISALQRAMAQANPEDYAHRGISNNTARVEALRGIAKDEQAMQAAIAARKSASDPLYSAADSAVVSSDDALREIMGRLPNGTLEQAQNIARMSGKPMQIGRDVPAQTILKDAAGEIVDPAMMKPPVGPKSRSILQEIKEAGGIRMDELGELNLAPLEAVRGNPGLFRRSGMSADDLVEFMQQKGWVDDAMISRADQMDTGGAQEMAKDYIRSALARDPVYHPSQAMDLYAHDDAMKAFGEFASNISKTEIPARNAQYTGRGLDLIKKAIDDVVDVHPGASIGKNARGAAMGVKNDLVQWADSHIPEYGAARQAWADGSVPITQMQVGKELLQKIEPALVQYHPSGAHFKQAGNAYANALNDARGTLVKNATGGINRNLEDVMSPQQMGTLNGIASDLSRASMGADLGRGTGSNTFQNFAMDNLAAQSGMPPAVAAIGNLLTLGQGAKIINAGKFVANKMYQGSDDAMKQSMADLLLNPQAAAGVMEKSVQPGRMSQTLIDALGNNGAKRAGELGLSVPGVLGASFAMPYGSQ